MDTLNIPESLRCIKRPPNTLYYKGNVRLMDAFKVAIIGTRRPNQYTKTITAILASKISKHATIVSGGAIGVDCIAHSNSLPNTIMVSPSSLDIIYPKENSTLINNIANSGLIISEYKNTYTPKPYSFIERNRIVIGISDIVIIPQGDINSGTHSSANIAIKTNKNIFTIPHRYKESTLTDFLIQEGNANVIYDIDEFIENYIIRDNNSKKIPDDEILEFCSNAINFDVAFKKFGSKLLEYELMGLLKRYDNMIKTK